MDFGPKNCIFGPKFCIFLRYTYETPIFSARTVPTQWDHKSPISWGNSGYLQFSGRWPFGRLAGRFVAPIAQSGPFGVQKCCFLARNHLFAVSLKMNRYNHNGSYKRQLWLYTLNFHNILKRFTAGCHFERVSTNLVDFLDKHIKWLYWFVAGLGAWAMPRKVFLYTL